MNMHANQRSNVGALTATRGASGRVVAPLLVTVLAALAASTSLSCRRRSSATATPEPSTSSGSAASGSASSAATLAQLDDDDPAPSLTATATDAADETSAADLTPKTIGVERETIADVVGSSPFSWAAWRRGSITLVKDDAGAVRVHGSVAFAMARPGGALERNPELLAGTLIESMT